MAWADGFGECCCRKDADAHDVDLATVQLVIGEGALHAPSDSDAASKASTDMEGRHSVSSSMSAGARETLLRCSRGLVKGHAVTLVKEWLGGPFAMRAPATLRLHQDAKTISVEGDGLRFSLKVTEIVDMFTVEDGRDHFPQGVLDNLAAEEVDRLVRIWHVMPDGGMMAFCMLEASPKERRALLLTLKALAARARKRSARRHPRH